MTQRKELYKCGDVERGERIANLKMDRKLGRAMTTLYYLQMQITVIIMVTITEELSWGLEMVL